MNFKIHHDEYEFFQKFQNFQSFFIPPPKYSPSNDLTTIEQLKLGTFEPRERSQKVTRGENKLFIPVNKTCFLTKVPTFSDHYQKIILYHLYLETLCIIMKIIITIIIKKLDV